MKDERSVDFTGIEWSRMLLRGLHLYEMLLENGENC
jgi:hypothetical protein